MRLRFVAAAAWFVLVSAAPAPSRAGGPVGPEAVIRAYVDAFNRHDPVAVAASLDTAFVWLSLAEDSISVTMRGPGEIRSGLVGYFKNLPDVRSTLEHVSTLGPYVSLTERVRWTGAKGPREQAALAVYEVRDGLIRRVWYFPEVRAAKP